ncbi:MAG TPA: hypothetical protein PK400_10495 [Phycisphaerales bacterium]|nr:hypothetical protein [Phycisphaerales bacterium]HRQ76926.1 hypothetical protein [Phycisphaerales bacterium]
MSTYLFSALAVATIAAVCLLAGCSTSKTQRVSMGATSDGEGYICPLTGEELPCPKCCPLNKGD